MTKAQLRKLYISKRNQLSQTEYEELNYALLERFKQVDLTSINCIHLFLPIHKRKEPDTFLIRDWLAVYHPHIKRVFPKANFAKSTLQNFVDDDQLKLAVNAFGIPEPVDGNVVDALEIDLVLVPLLAFDERGYRVGYGKGFYDRFLALCKPYTRFAGLSFFDPVCTIDDINEFDAKMHQCIAPSKFHLFD
jgi:5-formyltetrahydrofolate cyclo-ligase